MAKLKWKLVAFIAILIVVASGVTVFMTNTPPNNKKEDLPIRVACVGDSITNVSGYPDDLWMLLGEDYTVSKFGVGGSTVTLNSYRPYIYQPELQEAKDFQPNIVIIMLGTNDADPGLHRFNATFIDDYKQLVAEFQALATKPKIWIVKPPPIYGDGTGLSTKFLETNIIPSINQVANETIVSTIDVYSALTNRSECFIDGVHPNSLGSQLIAEAVYKALTSSF